MTTWRRGMHDTVKYNPLQQETAQFISHDCNVVVQAPTSSGKTIVAEQFMFTALAQGKRALYLSPLKALTNEKYEIWKDAGLNVIAITSDHERSPRPVTEKLILMTTEALDSRSRGAKPWLNEVGCVVCDEAHLLGAPKRGDAFEIGLTRFAQLNPSARIITLSATLPNVDEIKSWLTALNGKKTVIVNTNWRPVIQQHHLCIGPEREYQFMIYALDKISDIMDDHPDSQILIFVHTVSKGHQIARHFGIPFHYSKISKEERHNIEAAFRSKKLMNLVSTSTLAYGVNLPADVGIIVGAHRGLSLVEPWDIKQMAGRIGRYGLASTGDVYYLFRKDYAEDVFDELTNMPSVLSQLRDRLYFHVTSFVAREGMQRKQINEFLDRTLCRRQFHIHLEEAIHMLVQYGVLLDDNGVLSATRFGKASAYMYVDPIDLISLYNNLKDHPLTPGLVATALANIPSNAFETFVPDDFSHKIELGFGQQTIIASALYEWLTGHELSGTSSVIIPPYIMDFDRWASALGMCGLDKAYLKNLSLSIQYGIEENLLELVAIPKVGRKRALALSRFGITSKKDILANKQISLNILGQSIVQSIEEEIKNPGKLFIRY